MPSIKQLQLQSALKEKRKLYQDQPTGNYEVFMAYEDAKDAYEAATDKVELDRFLRELLNAELLAAGEGVSNSSRSRRCQEDVVVEDRANIENRPNIENRANAELAEEEDKFDFFLFR